MKEENFYDDFVNIKMRLEIWVNGVIIQVKRLKLDLIKLEEATEEFERWNYNVLRINDDNFLRIAINNSLNWLKEFNKYVEETNKICEELQKETKIKDLRNMTEHEVEYYYKEGHFQNRYIDKETNLSAFQTGVTDDDYLIGGRLSLKYIENKFRSLEKKLKRNKFNMNISMLIENSKNNI